MPGPRVNCGLERICVEQGRPRRADIALPRRHRAAKAGPEAASHADRRELCRHAELGAEQPTASSIAGGPQAKTVAPAGRRPAPRAAGRSPAPGGRPSRRRWPPPALRRRARPPGRAPPSESRAARPGSGPSSSWRHTSGAVPMPPPTSSGRVPPPGGRQPTPSGSDERQPLPRSSAPPSRAVPGPTASSTGSSARPRARARTKTRSGQVGPLVLTPAPSLGRAQHVELPRLRIGRTAALSSARIRT